MRIEDVEIFSEASNFAVMRHPGRHFPGILVQGDSLAIMCRQIDEIVEELKFHGIGPEFSAADALQSALHDRLQHYKTTLQDAGLKLPF